VSLRDWITVCAAWADGVLYTLLVMNVSWSMQVAVIVLKRFVKAEVIPAWLRSWGIDLIAFFVQFIFAVLPAPLAILWIVDDSLLAFASLLTGMFTVAASARFWGRWRDRHFREVVIRLVFAICFRTHIIRQQQSQ